MIRITITAEAFAAIERTLPIGDVGFEREPTEKGERQVWLEPYILAKLKAMRGAGEDYSDVILRLAGEAKPSRRSAYSTTSPPAPPPPPAQRRAPQARGSAR